MNLKWTAPPSSYKLARHVLPLVVDQPLLLIISVCIYLFKGLCPYLVVACCTHQSLRALYDAYSMAISGLNVCNSYIVDYKFNRNNLVGYKSDR